jgi:hypothetical protein
MPIRRTTSTSRALNDVRAAAYLADVGRCDEAKRKLAFAEAVLDTASGGQRRALRDEIKAARGSFRSCGITLAGARRRRRRRRR